MKTEHIELNSRGTKQSWKDRGKVAFTLLVVGKELEVAVLSLSNFLDQSSVVDFATRVQVPIRQAIDDNVENKICPFCDFCLT